MFIQTCSSSSCHIYYLNMIIIVFSYHEEGYHPDIFLKLSSEHHLFQNHLEIPSPILEVWNQNPGEGPEM